MADHYLVCWDRNLFLQAFDWSYDVTDQKAKIAPMSVRWTYDWRDACCWEDIADARDVAGRLAEAGCAVMAVGPRAVEADHG